jgi:F-type H+-transporting ATPase subunit epsilon
MSIDTFHEAGEFASPVDTGKSKVKTDGRVRCVVVTPESTLMDEPADFVVLPLFDGELGIAHGRAPLIGRLGSGEMRIKTGDSTRRLFVDGGFAQVRDDIVTVLTSRAVGAREIDVPAYQAELDRAKAIKAVTDIEQAEKDRSVERARAAIRVASKV